MDIDIQKATQPEPIPAIKLKDGSTYTPPRDLIQKWYGVYQNIDVLMELRHMEEWCESNPQKRKTKRGVRTFVTSWLSRADKHAAPKRVQEPTPSPLPKATPIPRGPIPTQEEADRQAGLLKAWRERRHT